MHSLHPQARTTPAVRIEIARSTEPTGVLAVAASRLSCLGFGAQIG